MQCSLDSIFIETFYPGLHRYYKFKYLNNYQMINLTTIIGQLRYFEAQIDSTLLNLLKELEEIVNFLHHISLPNFLRICQQNLVTRGKNCYDFILEL